MKNRDYAATLEFIALLHREVTEQNIELRAVANERDSAIEPRALFTRDLGEVEVFVGKYDVPGRAVYLSAVTRARGSHKGSRANCRELSYLWVDVDTRKLGLDKATVIAAAKSLPYPPSIEIDSGGGLHFYWLLKEALDVDPALPGAEDLEERVVLVLRRLADVLAGDTTVCDLARILRLPGTHNSKPGVDALCTIIATSERRYDFDLFDEWLFQQRVLVRRPQQETPQADDDADNPYLAAAKAFGFKPPVDVEKRLAAMRYQGDGDASIHQTQLHCSGALVAAGIDDDKIVAMLLDATQIAAGTYANSWNWRREERAIRDMIKGARAKGYAPQKEAEAPPPPPDQEEAVGAENVYSFKNAQEKRKADEQQQQQQQKQAKPKKEKTNGIEQVAAAVVAFWQEHRGPLLSTDGALWTYADGTWLPVEGALAAALRVDISGMTRAMQAEITSSFLNNVYRAIVEDKALFVECVDWNSSGLIVGRNGAIDPKTRRIVPHDKAHYANYRVEADLDPALRCPKFLAFLQTNFLGSEQAQIIDTLAEFSGASLTRHKTRELMKALVPYGPTRTGKTQLAIILRALIGGKPCGMRARDLEDKFGMQPLIGASAWIADDAVSTGEFLDAERFKIIVTGEPVSIMRKNLTNWEGQLDLPVVLTANHLPRVRDQSDAVYNRSLILPMLVQHPETGAGARSLAEIIIEEELGGILNWALDGLQKLLTRHYYDPPQFMVTANRQFRAENTPIRSWLEVGVEANRFYMVDRRDILASFYGWYSMEYGADARPIGARALIPAIRQAMPDLTDHRHATARFMVGMRLTEEGIGFIQMLRDQSYGKTVGSGASDVSINRLAPTPKSEPEEEPPSRTPRF